jgi:hypothetical protein
MSPQARVGIPLVLCSFLLIGCGPARPNAEDVRQDLAKALPLQSTPSQVIDYLSREKIEHSEYLRDPMQGNSIKAAVRDKSKWNIVKTDCCILFRFDEHDRLVAYEVRERYTGP